MRGFKTRTSKISFQSFDLDFAMADSIKQPSDDVSVFKFIAAKVNGYPNGCFLDIISFNEMHLQALEQFRMFFMQAFPLFSQIVLHCDFINLLVNRRLNPVLQSWLMYRICAFCRDTACRIRLTPIIGTRFEQEPQSLLTHQASGSIAFLSFLSVFAPLR